MSSYFAPFDIIRHSSKTLFFVSFFKTYFIRIPSAAATLQNTVNFSLKWSISDFPLITNFWVTNLFTHILLLLLFGKGNRASNTKTILIYYSSIKWLRLSNCQIVSGSAHVILSCHPTVNLQGIIIPVLCHLEHQLPV